MIALFNKLLDWFKALFWKEEMELTLVGLQYSGKTTFVNVIAVRGQMWQPAPRPGQPESPPGVAGHRRAPGREEPAPGAWGLAPFLGDQLACYPFSGLGWGRGSENEGTELEFRSWRHREVSRHRESAAG